MDQIAKRALEQVVRDMKHRRDQLSPLVDIQRGMLYPPPELSAISQSHSQYCQWIADIEAVIKSPESQPTNP